MSRASKRISKYKELQKDKDNGIVQGIPLWHSFPKFSKIVPSLKKGDNHLITTFSGVGKTQFFKWYAIIAPFLAEMKEAKKARKEGRDKPFSVRYVVFLLEETRDEFEDSLICTMLYIKYKIAIDPLTLNSSFEESVSNDVLEKIDKIRGAIDALLEKIDIVDSIYNTVGMYKYCREVSENIGTHYYTHLYGNKVGKEKITREQYNELPEAPASWKDHSFETVCRLGSPFDYKDYWKYDSYVPDDPNEYVIMGMDNLNLIEPDREEKELLKAVPNWTAKFCRKNMCIHWGWICINVQQQDQGSEKAQYSFSGESIIDKLKPSLGGLGDAKRSQRDMTLILGIFAPGRHKIKEYLGYDTLKLKDRFRSISILKNRKGRSNVELGMYFRGECNYFEELPKEMDVTQYDKYLN